MPLLAEPRVVEREVVGPARRGIDVHNHRFTHICTHYLAVELHDFHLAALGQQLLRVEEVLTFAEVHVIPAVKAFPSGAAFVFLVVREDSFKGLAGDEAQRVVAALRACRKGFDVGVALLDAGGVFLAELDGEPSDVNIVSGEFLSCNL